MTTFTKDWKALGTTVLAQHRLAAPQVETDGKAHDIGQRPDPGEAAA